jgi:hypothetical protein
VVSSFFADAKKEVMPGQGVVYFPPQMDCCTCGATQSEATWLVCHKCNDTCVSSLCFEHFLVLTCERSDG